MRPGHPRRTTTSLIPFAFLLAVFAIACGSDKKSPVEPPGSVDYDSITVDASAEWAAIQLGAPAKLVTVANGLGSSSEWDIAFNATSVQLNGGEAGPGGVSGFCICQNAAASDADVGKMTAASERAHFTQVTTAQIPASASAWRSDSLALAISGWWSYDMTSHVVSAAPDKVWLVRTASGTAYAKFHVTGISGGTRTSAGQVTFEYALQPAAGQPMGAPQSHVVTVPDDGSAVYFDLDTGHETTKADSRVWDIAFHDYAIVVNGGASGSAGAAAVLTESSFNDLSTADGVPATAYKADGFGGVFAENRWYRYNITGNDHQIWPTYDVYLIKRGSTIYKVQLTSYYSTTAAPRHITIRYAKLEG